MKATEKNIELRNKELELQKPCLSIWMQTHLKLTTPLAFLVTAADYHLESLTPQFFFGLSQLKLGFYSFQTSLIFKSTNKY